jgi:hypothetical protein
VHYGPEQISASATLVYHLKFPSRLADSHIPEPIPEATMSTSMATIFQELEDLGTHRRGDLMKGKDSWSEPGGRPFKVRGKTFTMDRRKVRPQQTVSVDA